MKLEITNGIITAGISEAGGGLVSLRDAAGKEYLWQGDPRFWAGQAPNLFPFVGRFTQGKYLLDGQEYQMETHGFFRRREIALRQRTETSAVLGLRADEGTLALYPRRFDAEITYRLEENRVEMTFGVENLDEKPMFFGYGGHPGFFVPLDEGLEFEDYLLDFGAKCAPEQIGLSDACFVQGPDTPFPLEDGRYLPLSHSLFDRDAVVLRGMPSSVTLRSPKGKRSVTVTYPRMEYLGLWHKPKCAAPYLCIEPWTSLPSRQDVVEDLAQKPDMIRLEPGEKYRNSWSIALG